MLDYLLTILCGLLVVSLVLVVGGLINSDIGEPSKDIQPAANAQQVKSAIQINRKL